MNAEIVTRLHEEALVFLSRARQAGVPDPAEAGVYLLALEDLDPTLLQRACESLAKEPRREFQPAMPAVGDIRERCELIQREDAEASLRAKLLPPPAYDPNEPRYFCLDCKDETSAWAPRYCIGVGDLRVVGPAPDGSRVEPCGRLKMHMPHPFVVRCHCYETNPVSAKRREKERVRRNERTERRTRGAA